MLNQYLRITKILEDRILEYFDLRECQNQIRPLTSDVKNSMSKCRFYKCVSYATLPVRNLECICVHQRQEPSK